MPQSSHFIFIIVLTCLNLTALEPSPVGVWRTIDDITHKPRALVRIFQRNDELFGKIEASLDPAEAKEKCERCSDDRHNKPVIGMIVMRNMKKHGGEYSGGDILDPDTGQIYKCRFTIEDGGRKLVVRGYILMPLLGRSQTWWRE